jgi:hypothetical protein
MLILAGTDREVTSAVWRLAGRLPSRRLQITTGYEMQQLIPIQHKGRGAVERAKSRVWGGWCISFQDFVATIGPAA